MLSFGHEGVLYHRSFVMYDRQTQSLWIHTTGRAVNGPLRGEQLEFLPSDVVRWRVWEDRHPDTLVLDRGGQDQGFMGTFALLEASDEYGISVVRGADATLYPYELLRDREVVHHEDQVVAYDVVSEAVRAYEREGRTFELVDRQLDGGQLVDGTGARWELLSGEALGEDVPDLERIPATAFLIERWRGFHPDGEIVGGGG